VATIESRIQSGTSVHGLAVAFLVLLAAACYWAILNTFFVQDDFFFLAAAQQPMPNVEMLRGTCFFRPLPTYWLPLLNLSLWGLEPFGHHLINFSLFLATIAVLYLWLFEMTRSAVAAWVGAGLYAFSKTHLYTLAWIAGGIDVTAALFFVLALWMIDRFLKQSAQTDGQTNRKLLWAIGVLFACGLLCKESCVVLVPACLGWIGVRMILARRWFESAERKLALVLIAILAVYLPLWKIASKEAGRSESQLQFNIGRGLTVLQDSVIAVVPAAESSLPRSAWWLLPPLALAALAMANRRRRAQNASYLVLGISLWILPAAIFAFTKYPWVLQLYYAHFSVIGLVVLAALAVDSLADAVKATRWQTVAACTAAVLLAAWIGLSGRTIQAGIHDRASPALFEADLARAAHEQLDATIRSRHYRRVIFFDLSELMWASMQYGDMMQVFFPWVTAQCDGHKGFEAPEGAKTTSTTLVVRQTGPRNLSIVR